MPEQRILSAGVIVEAIEKVEESVRAFACAPEHSGDKAEYLNVLADLKARVRRLCPMPDPDAEYDYYAPFARPQ